MLEIRTTGFDDFLDGSANIKALIIGGPGAGKTRYSSFWPKPFFIDCEDGRGSIADRGVPYVRTRSSKDMLDVLEYLKGLQSVPKAQRKHQTIVVDTADSFQRIVKDEWVQNTKAGAFSGFDAWGYLDAKMQLLFTRLLNLDYNVVVLVHYKDKTYKDGDNTVRELTLQLQGAIADQIFNDFGLVGWMGTYWEAGEEGRVQKRGLTFQPTPEKPFLKDRFNVTPKWMEVTFSDTDYQQLFEAFTLGDLEAIPESDTVGEVPDSETQRAAAAGPVSPPSEGGPLPPRAPAEIPLDKMLKADLEVRAKALGVAVRGNMLKSEIVGLITYAEAAAKAKEPTPQVTGSASEAPATPDPTPAGTETPATTSPSTGESSPKEGSDPWVPASGVTPSGTSSSATGTQEKPASPVTTPSDESAEAAVTDKLGGTVISEEPADTPGEQSVTPPTEVAKPSAPTGPSACADCGVDLAADRADPVKKNAVRLSYVKFRRYLCAACLQQSTT